MALCRGLTNRSQRSQASGHSLVTVSVWSPRWDGRVLGEAAACLHREHSPGALDPRGEQADRSSGGEASCRAPPAAPWGQGVLQGGRGGGRGQRADVAPVTVTCSFQSAVNTVKCEVFAPKSGVQVVWRERAARGGAELDGRPSRGTGPARGSGAGPRCPLNSVLTRFIGLRPRAHATVRRGRAFFPHKKIN